MSLEKWSSTAGKYPQCYVLIISVTLSKQKYMYFLHLLLHINQLHWLAVKKYIKVELSTVVTMYNLRSRFMLSDTKVLKMNPTISKIRGFWKWKKKPTFEYRRVERHFTDYFY